MSAVAVNDGDHQPSTSSSGDMNLQGVIKAP